MTTVQTYSELKAAYAANLAKRCCPKCLGNGALPFANDIFNSRTGETIVRRGVNPCPPCNGTGLTPLKVTAEGAPIA